MKEEKTNGNADDCAMDTPIATPAPLLISSTCLSSKTVKLITKRAGRYWYFDISVKFSTREGLQFKTIDLMQFKISIEKSLRQLFGECGSSIPIDILRYSERDKRGIIRCPTEHYVKLRSSLTIARNFEDCEFYYQVNKASPNLLSLLANSRTYVHS